MVLVLRFKRNISPLQRPYFTFSILCILMYCYFRTRGKIIKQIFPTSGVRQKVLHASRQRLIIKYWNRGFSTNYILKVFLAVRIDRHFSLPKNALEGFQQELLLNCVIYSTAGVRGRSTLCQYHSIICKLFVTQKNGKLN